MQYEVGENSGSDRPVVPEATSRRALSRRDILKGAAAVPVIALANKLGRLPTESKLGRLPRIRVGASKAPPTLGPRPSSLSMLYDGNQGDSAGVLAVLPLLKHDLGIDLKVTNLPENAEEIKAFGELATGLPAHDLYLLDTPWIPTLTHVLEPLSSYYMSSALNEGLNVDPADFIPKVFYDTTVFKIDSPSLHYPHSFATVNVDSIVKNGFEILGMPQQANALTMSYRTDLFESATEKASFKTKYGRELTVPETWDEFVQVAQFFTRPSANLYGTTLMAGVGDWDIDDFKTMVGSFGGDGHLINDNLGVTVSQPVAVAALQFYVDLIRKYKVAPPGVTAASWDTAGSLFSTGRTAMTMNYSPQSLDSNVGGSIGNAMVPKKVAYAPHFGSQLMAIPLAGDPNRKAWAYRVAAWLTSTRAQVAMLPEQIHPARASVFAEAEKSAAVKKLYGNFYPILHQSLASGVGRCRVEDYTEVVQPVAVGVNNAASGVGTPEANMKTTAAAVVATLASLGLHGTVV